MVFAFASQLAKSAAVAGVITVVWCELREVYSICRRGQQYG